MKHRQISLDSFLEFEIEAYKVETELALEKHRAEMQITAILNSRTWRYTRWIRAFVAFLMIPLLKAPKGVRLLQSLNKLLP